MEKGVKALLVSTGIYMIAGLMLSMTGEITPPPSPPSPPGSLTIWNFGEWLGFFGALVVYIFNIFSWMIANAAQTLSFSFIPSPLNILVSIPLLLLFIYGIVSVIYAILRSLPVFKPF